MFQVKTQEIESVSEINPNLDQIRTKSGPNQDLILLGPVQQPDYCIRKIWTTLHCTKLYTIQILFDKLLKKFHNRMDTNLYSLVATIYILMIFWPNMILTQHMTWPLLGF